jgi:hypothetical protein
LIQTIPAWDRVCKLEVWGHDRGGQTILNDVDEFDRLGLSPERLDAQHRTENLRDFMAVAFSSSSVQGFLMWSFWEGCHCLLDAALYRIDLNLKPDAQVYKNLLFKR